MDHQQSTGTSPQQQLRELALFAGAGGGILAGHLLGWRCVCAVEIDPYAQAVLCARQNDGSLPPFPIWDDIVSFDGRPWRGIVDVVSGGFPCTDISAAGKGAGIGGEKSGLWKEMARVIREVEPRYVFVENSPMLTVRGLGVVLGDLASLGFNARWGVLGAVHAGAPHKRDRIWIVATHPDRQPIRQQPERKRGLQSEAVSSINGLEKPLADSHSEREPQPQGRESVSTRRTRNSSQEIPHPDRAQREGEQRAERVRKTHADSVGVCWWEVEPNVGRVVDVLAARLDRLRCIGNGQVPRVGALAWKILGGEMSGESNGEPG